MSTHAIDSGTVPVRVFLPIDLYRSFAARAESKSADVEDVIREHLSSTKDQDIERGRTLKVSVEDRQSIETAFGRNFKDGHELAHYLRQVYSVRVNDGEDVTTITLSPDLFKRLHGRRGRMEFRAFLIETITRQLEHFAGMR